MPKGRPVDPCTCGDAKEDHWRGAGWCTKCGCTWWHPKDPAAYLAKLEKERAEKIKTIGDAIRKHMEIVARHLDEMRDIEAADLTDTDDGKKFLELPPGKRFNTAGNIYLAALQMLNEAVETVDGLMWGVVAQTAYPKGQGNPERDQAVIRGWELLEYFGRLQFDPPEPEDSEEE